MGVVRTSAGGVYYSQLRSNLDLDYTFGTLIAGRGNNATGVLDTTASITQRLPVAIPARPVYESTDHRNPGRGAEIYSFTFEVSPPTEPWVASNLAVATDPLFTSHPLAIHADETVSADPFRTLLVFFNLSGGGATLFTSYEAEPTIAAQLRSVGSRADVLYGGQGSVALRPGYIESPVRAGESVILRGRLYGQDLQALRSVDVRHGEMHLEAFDADRGRWEPVLKRSVHRCVLDRVQSELSALFPYRGGFNFEHILEGAATRDGRDKRMTFTLKLSDGSSKVLTQTVPVD